jgi:TonB family protein
VIVLKTSIVLAIALTAILTMRRRPAAARHWVLSIAIVCAALVPFLEIVAPAWGFELFTPRVVSSAVAGERDLARLAWIAGTTISLASLVAGLVRLVWLRVRARRVTDPAWCDLVRDLSGELGIARPVTILESDAHAMPITWGLWRPRVLLPSAARTWSAERLRVVIGHELAHVQRGDWSMQLVAEIAAAVYWFNPLMWIARRRLRFESDRACDDAVLALGVSGADYAAELVRVARELRQRRSDWRTAPALARAGQLERRVAAALNAGLDRAPVSAARSAAVFLALVGAATAIAGFSPLTAMNVSASSVPGVQRNIMMRLGAQDWRVSIVARDVSFWKNRIEGRVELQARLTADGSLSGVHVVEPVHPDLATAAEAIARQWRRQPALLRGVPVEVPVRMTVDFTR